MTQARISIEAQKREVSGKKNSTIRKDGQLTAVVYGPHRKSTNIQLSEKEAADLVRKTTSSSIVTLKLDGEEVKAFIAEVQTNPRYNKLTHLSFFEPDPDKMLNVPVELNPVGIAPAVKNNLGILFFPFDHMTVRGLPKDIVDHIDIDVSGLEDIGDSIKMEQVKIPDGLELAHEEDKVKAIVTITGFQKEIEEEVVAPAEGEEGAEGAAPAEGETPAEGAPATPAEDETPAAA